jgi:hypothetical protein
MILVLHRDIFERFRIEYSVQSFSLNNSVVLIDHIIYHYYNEQQIHHEHDHYQVQFLHYDNQ